MRITFDELREKQNVELQYPSKWDAESMAEYQTRLKTFLDKYGFTMSEYIDGLGEIVIKESNKRFDKTVS